MSRCYVYSGNSKKVLVEKDVFYMEDFYSSVSGEWAKNKTNEIFTDFESQKLIRSTSYYGYEVYWSFYDLVFDGIRKFYAYDLLWEKLECYEEVIVFDIEKTIKMHLDLRFGGKKLYFKNTFKNTIKSTAISFVRDAMHFFLVLYSLLSILILKTTQFGEKKCAIFTMDLLVQGYDSDFRMINIYQEIRRLKIPFIEFIRSVNPKHTLQNIFVRRRPAFYIYSFQILAEKIIRLLSFRDQIRKKSSTLYSFENEARAIIFTSMLVRHVLWHLNIKSVVAYYFGSRTAPLLIAAKSLKIPVVGFMHGFAMPNWNVNEFIESFNGMKKLGPDFFGVWSKFAFSIFKSHAKILPENSLELSGPIRPFSFHHLETDSTSVFSRVRPKVLFVTTIISDPKEVASFLSALIASNLFEIGIKVRPMVRDVIYEQLLEIVPDLNRLPVFSGNILEVGKNFDVFVSTGSAALIEAALIGKLSVTYFTKRIGDFYQFDLLIPGVELCVKSPDEISSHILWRINNESTLQTISIIREQFFEVEKNGAAWVAMKVKKCLESAVPE